MTEGLRLPEESSLGLSDTEVEAHNERWQTLDEAEITLTRLQMMPISMPTQSQPQLDARLLDTSDPKAYSERFVSALAWHSFFIDRYNAALLDYRQIDNTLNDLKSVLTEEQQQKKRATEDKKKKLSDTAIKSVVENDPRVRELKLEVQKRNQLVVLIEGRMKHFSKVEKMMSRYIEMIKVNVQMETSNSGQPRTSW